MIPRELIFDNSMSDRARFLYCYMASKPGGWDFVQTNMCAELGYSVETLKKYTDELISKGWLEKISQQNGENGKFGCNTYVLHISRAEIYRYGNLPLRKNLERSSCSTIPYTGSNNNIEGSIKGDDKYNPSVERKENTKRKTDEKKTFLGIDLTQVPDDFVDAIKIWLEYKKDRRQSYKQTGFNVMLKQLMRFANNDANTAMQIVERSIANNWSGLFELDKKDKQAKQQPQPKKQQSFNDFNNTDYLSQQYKAEEQRRSTQQADAKKEEEYNEKKVRILNYFSENCNTITKLEPGDTKENEYFTVTGMPDGTIYWNCKVGNCRRRLYFNETTRKMTIIPLDAPNRPKGNGSVNNWNWYDGEKKWLLY